MLFISLVTFLEGCFLATGAQDFGFIITWLLLLYIVIVKLLTYTFDLDTASLCNNFLYIGTLLLSVITALSSCLYSLYILTAVLIEMLYAALCSVIKIITNVRRYIVRVVGMCIRHVKD